MHATGIVITTNYKYIISTSKDWTLRIYYIYKCREGAVLRGHEGVVNSIAIISNNNCVVSGSEGITMRYETYRNIKWRVCWRGILTRWEEQLEQAVISILYQFLSINIYNMGL